LSVFASDASKKQNDLFFKSCGEYDRCDVGRIGRKPHPDWTGRIMLVGLFLISVASDATDLLWTRRNRYITHKKHTDDRNKNNINNDVIVIVCECVSDVRSIQ